MSRSGDPQRPALTVDIVVLSSAKDRAQVLLIRRKKSPFAGYWALPGGFVEPFEALEQAARRELREETGATPPQLEQLHTFGDPGRDPRGWTVTVVYLALLDSEAAADGAWPLNAGSDATEIGWFDLDNLPPLAFDHEAILNYARRRLERGRNSGWSP